MSGFCAVDSQCLVHLQGNAGYDGDLQRWFTGITPADRPKCINHTQYVLDYYCNKGNWTTRTKLLALQLLQVADVTSPTNFTLFCDSYNRVLNQYHYLVQNVLVENYLKNLCPSPAPGKSIPCVNSLCVLKTPGMVAIGAPLNVPINHPQRSFLFALEQPITSCDGVSGNASQKCGTTPVWYNPAINTAILLPSGSLTQPAPQIRRKITGPLGSISSYVMSFLHNPALNFAYFPKTRLLNRLYVAQDGDRALFGFLETGLRPEYDPVPLDYIGVRYTGIDFAGLTPGQVCLNLIKTYDTKAFCENQTGVVSGFNVIARHRCEPTQPQCQGASPIVAVWPALTGKLRP